MKSLGSLDTKGVEEHVQGEVSDDFVKRNGGIAGLRSRNRAPAETTAETDANEGSSSPGQEEGMDE